MLHLYNHSNFNRYIGRRISEAEARLHAVKPPDYQDISEVEVGKVIIRSVGNVFVYKY